MAIKLQQEYHPLYSRIEGLYRRINNSMKMDKRAKRFQDLGEALAHMLGKMDKVGSKLKLAITVITLGGTMHANAQTIGLDKSSNFGFMVVNAMEHAQFTPVASNDDKGSVNKSTTGSGTICQPITDMTAQFVTFDGFVTGVFEWQGNAMQYDFYYRKAGTTAWNKNTVLSSQAVIRNLEPNTQYDWQVKGTCVGDVSSGWSALLTSVQTPSGFHCGIPGQTNTKSISTSSAKLSWDTTDGAETYVVQYRKTATSLRSIVYSSTNSITLSQLDPSAEYTWKVKARCRQVVSEFSDTSVFNTVAARQNNIITSKTTASPNPTYGKSTMIGAAAPTNARRTTIRSKR